MVDDDEIKASLAAEHPYGQWLAAGPGGPERPAAPVHAHPPARQRGHPSAAVRLHGRGAPGHLIAPMAKTGIEPNGSMGSDAAIAVLSDRSAAALRLLHPAVRPGHQPAPRRHPRGAGHLAGGHRRPRGQPARSHARLVPPDRAAPAGDRPRRPGQAHVRQRARRDAGLQGLRGRRALPGGQAGEAGRPTPEGGQALAEAIDGSAPRSSRAIAGGANLIVLSDRNSTVDLAPIPSLLLTAAVHHHLVREKTRTRVGLVVESGDAREVHHMALLDRVRGGRRQPLPGPRDPRRHDRRRPARGGLAPPGPPQLHQGGLQGRAQDHVQDGHLDGGLLHRGPGLRGGGPRPRGGGRVLHRDTQPHRRGRSGRPGRRGGHPAPPGPSGPADQLAHRELEVGGEYQWRREGEHHLFNPKTVFKLQHATRAKRYEVFKEYTQAVDDQSEQLATLRGLLRLRPAGAARSPSTRSSRSRRSWPASPPGPCPTAPSRPRPTRPWPSP